MKNAEDSRSLIHKKDREQCIRLLEPAFRKPNERRFMEIESMRSPEPLMIVPSMKERLLDSMLAFQGVHLQGDIYLAYQSGKLTHVDYRSLCESSKNP